MCLGGFIYYSFSSKGAEASVKRASGYDTSASADRRSETEQRRRVGQDEDAVEPRRACEVGRQRHLVLGAIGERCAPAVVRSDCRTAKFEEAKTQTRSGDKGGQPGAGGNAPGAFADAPDAI